MQVCTEWNIFSIKSMMVSHSTNFIPLCSKMLSSCSSIWLICPATDFRTLVVSLLLKEHIVSITPLNTYGHELYLGDTFNDGIRGVQIIAEMRTWGQHHYVDWETLISVLCETRPYFVLWIQIAWHSSIFLTVSILTLESVWCQRITKPTLTSRQ